MRVTHDCDPVAIEYFGVHMAMDGHEKGITLLPRGREVDIIVSSGTSGIR